jgi:hypothetical protein
VTALVVVLTVVVALQLVLIVGLLRGHAEVLRRLHEFGAGLDPDASRRADGTLPVPDPARVRQETAPLAAQLGPLPAAEGRRAHDVSGVTPREEVAAVRTTEVDHDTLLVFLSSSCSGCAPFWPALAEPDLDADTRVVVVTREEPDEDLDEIRQLAPPGLTVVMSNAAYTDHEVPGSPYVVHVEGRTGRIRGEGTAASWPAVKKLLLRGSREGRTARAKAAADARRERDADRHLLAAGIAPGDPSLYKRADGTDVAVDADGRPIEEAS